MTKRLLVVLAAVLGLWTATAHAQPVSGRVILDHPQRWSAGFVNIAATLTEIRPIPTASTTAHYVTVLNIQTTTATSGTYALQSGTGTNCGTSTTAVFPKTATGDRFNAPINTGPMASITFAPPIKLTAGHALCIIGVATNTVSGQVQGFTGP